MMKWYTQFALFLVLVALCSPVSADGSVIYQNGLITYVSSEYTLSLGLLKRGLDGQFTPFFFIPSILPYQSGWDIGVYDPVPTVFPNVYKLIIASSVGISPYGEYGFIVELDSDTNCFEDIYNSCETDDIKINLDNECMFVMEPLIDPGYKCTDGDILSDGPDCEFIYDPHCNFTYTAESVEVDFGVLPNPDGTTTI